MSSPPPSSSDPPLAIAASEPRTAFELEAALDELLDAVLSSRRTATHLAQEIAALPRAEQDFVLHWVSVIARTNAEMAFQFAAAAPHALRNPRCDRRRSLDHPGDGRLRPRRALSRQPGIQGRRAVFGRRRGRRRRPRFRRDRARAAAFRARAFGTADAARYRAARVHRHRHAVLSGARSARRDSRRELSSVQGDGGAALGAEPLRHLQRRS